MAYQVCNQHHSSAPMTAYWQQWMLLWKQDKLDPQPCKEFQHDLIQLLQQHINNQHKVIIMLEANENLSHDKSNLGQALQRAGMVNTYHIHHRSTYGISEDPLTYSRGSKCIDYIYCTANISTCGYTPFQEGISVSDHQGIFVDINLGSLLGKSTKLPSIWSWDHQSKTLCKWQHPEGLHD